eukprot:gene6532-4708_t
MLSFSSLIEQQHNCWLLFTCTWVGGAYVQLRELAVISCFVFITTGCALSFSFSCVPIIFSCKIYLLVFFFAYTFNPFPFRGSSTFTSHFTHIYIYIYMTGRSILSSGARRRRDHGAPPGTNSSPPLSLSQQRLFMSCSQGHCAVPYLDSLTASSQSVNPPATVKTGQRMHTVERGRGTENTQMKNNAAFAPPPPPPPPLSGAGAWGTSYGPRQSPRAPQETYSLPHHSPLGGTRHTIAEKALFIPPTPLYQSQQHQQQQRQRAGLSSPPLSSQTTQARTVPLSQQSFRVAQKYAPPPPPPPPSLGMDTVLPVLEAMHTTLQQHVMLADHELTTERRGVEGIERMAEELGHIQAQLARLCDLVEKHIACQEHPPSAPPAAAAAAAAPPKHTSLSQTRQEEEEEEEQQRPVPSTDSPPPPAAAATSSLSSSATAAAAAEVRRKRQRSGSLLKPALPLQRPSDLCRCPPVAPPPPPRHGGRRLRRRSGAPDAEYGRDPLSLTPKSPPPTTTTFPPTRKREVYALRVMVGLPILSLDLLLLLNGRGTYINIYIYIYIYIYLYIIIDSASSSSLNVSFYASFVGRLLSSGLWLTLRNTCRIQELPLHLSLSFFLTLLILHIYFIRNIKAVGSQRYLLRCVVFYIRLVWPLLLTPTVGLPPSYRHSHASRGGGVVQPSYFFLLFFWCSVLTQRNLQPIYIYIYIYIYILLFMAYLGADDNFHATEAALRFLQERRGCCDPSPIPLPTTAEMHLPIGKRSRAHRTTTGAAVDPYDGRRYSTNVGACAEKDMDNNNGLLTTTTTTAAAGSSWSRAFNTVNARVEGGQIQMELERSVRECALREMRATTAQQMAEVWAVVRQIREENTFLKQSVRALEARHAWGGSGGVGGGAGASADGPSGVVALGRRLEELEATVRQHHHQWSGKSSRLGDTLAEQVRTEMEVELQRMRSLARETAQQATADLIRQEVNAERDAREAAELVLQRRLDEAVASTVASTAGRADRLERSTGEQLAVLQRMVEATAADTAAAPTAAALLAEVDRRVAALRQPLEAQMAALQREASLSHEAAVARAVERELALRLQVEEKVQTHLDGLAQRFATPADVAAGLGGVRQAVGAVQDAVSEVRTAVAARQRESESLAAAVAALERSLARQSEAIAALQRSATEGRQAAQAATEELAACQAHRHEVERQLQELQDATATLCRGQVKQQQQVDTMEQRAQSQLKELRHQLETVEASGRQSALRLESLTTDAARCAALCEATQTSVDKRCTGPLKAVEKQCAALEQQLQEVHRTLVLTVEETVPRTAAALRDDAAALRTKMEQQLTVRIAALQTEVEGHHRHVSDRVDRLAETWQRFSSDVPQLRPDDVRQQADAAVQAALQGGVAHSIEMLRQKQQEMDSALRQEIQRAVAEAIDASSASRVAATPSEREMAVLMAPSLQVLQGQLTAIRQEMAETDARRLLEMEEAGQRLQRRIDADTRRHLRLESASSAEAAEARVTALLQERDAVLQTQIAAAVCREVYGTSSPTASPLRLVSRIAADAAARKELALALQQEFPTGNGNDDGEPTGGHGGASLTTSAVGPLLAEQLQRRLRACEEWRGIAEARLDAVEDAAGELESKVQQYAQQLKKAQHEKSQNDAVSRGEQAEREAQVEARVARVEAQLASRARSTANPMRAAPEVVLASLVESAVQPLTLQVRGLEERQRGQLEAHEAFKMVVEERILGAAERMEGSLRRRADSLQEHIIGIEEALAAAQRRSATEQKALKEEEKKMEERVGSCERRLDELGKQLATDRTAAAAAQEQLLRSMEANPRLTNMEARLEATDRTVEQCQHQLHLHAQAEHTAAANTPKDTDILVSCETKGEQGGACAFDPDQMEALAELVEANSKAVEGRLRVLEAAVASVQDAEDAGLAATIHLCSDLQHGLEECVTLVRAELHTPEWTTLRQQWKEEEEAKAEDWRRDAEEEEDGDTDAAVTDDLDHLRGLDDVLLYLLRSAARSHIDIRTLHGTLVSVLDVLQQHEMDVTATAHASRSNSRIISTPPPSSPPGSVMRRRKAVEAVSQEEILTPP